MDGRPASAMTQSIGIDDGNRRDKETITTTRPARESCGKPIETDARPPDRGS